jgi:hypothetical protein
MSEALQPPSLPFFCSLLTPKAEDLVITDKENKNLTQDLQSRFEAFRQRRMVWDGAIVVSV